MIDVVIEAVTVAPGVHPGAVVLWDEDGVPITMPMHVRVPNGRYREMWMNVDDFMALMAQVERNVRI